MPNHIAENIRSIRNQLPTHVTLVAVSKTKSVGLIEHAYQAGQRDFGENYIQELQEKQPKLPADIRWHAIGHLQSNKVKYIASYIYLIHGVDSLNLIKEINKQALKNNRVINCLLQIHIAQEETKFGFSYEECEELLHSNELQKLKNVQVLGFMGMASNTDSKLQVRNEFRTLKKFFSNMASSHANISILSMGMSQDYAIAIEEGSNMVRIGSLIFGERNYVK